MIRFLTILGFLGWGGIAIAAAPYLYDCDMRYIERGKGWISPKIAVVLPGDGTVKIVDAVILTFNRDALVGKVLRDTASRLVITWTVKRTRAHNGRSFANFDYRASITKASGLIEVSAIPRELDSGVNGIGNCSKRTK